MPDEVEDDAVLGQLSHANDAVLSSLLALVRNSVVDDGVGQDTVRALEQLGHADEAVLSKLLALVRDENEDSNVRSAAY